MRQAPDKNRWDTWVTLAWVVAIAVCGFSVFLILTKGMIHIQRPPIGGYELPSDTEVNWMVFSIAIGQSLGALFMAVMFSIINGAYRNSCDNLELLHRLVPKEKTINTDNVVPEKSGSGLRVTFVNENSPLKKHLCLGYVIDSVNGVTPDTLKSLRSLLIDGENELVFTTIKGECQTVKFHASNGQIGIKAERT